MTFKNMSCQLSNIMTVMTFKTSRDITDLSDISDFRVNKKVSTLQKRAVSNAFCFPPHIHIRLSCQHHTHVFAQRRSILWRVGSGRPTQLSSQCCMLKENENKDQYANRRGKLKCICNIHNRCQRRAPFQQTLCVKIRG